MDNQFEFWKYVLICVISIILSIIVGESLFADEIQYESSNDEIRVMVIDTGIGYNVKLKPYVQYQHNNIDYVDKFNHGTAVTGILLYGNKELSAKPLCKQVKVFSCRWLIDQHVMFPTSENKLINCIKKATRLRMNYINISVAGPGFIQKEYEALKSYSDSGGVTVVAIGNEHKNLQDTPIYPASYAFNNKIKSVIVVENAEVNGRLATSSNWHPLALRVVGTDVLSTFSNNRYGRVSGSSFAAPTVLHNILQKKCEAL